MIAAALADTNFGAKIFNSPSKISFASFFIVLIIYFLILATMMLDANVSAKNIQSFHKYLLPPFLLF